VLNFITTIFNSFITIIQGLKLTLSHAVYAMKKFQHISVENPNYFKQKNGIVTLQYPYEKLEVPSVGRYKLHNEIEDCIVCDKCAKICPVNCIEIEAIKSTGEIGLTSDGTPKRLYAAVFDIDMAKCCYCGLCTTVCPTECLTMTSDYDFSVSDIKKLKFGFSNMTQAEIEEKKQAYAQLQIQKLNTESQQNQKISTQTASSNEVIKSKKLKPKITGKSDMDIKKNNKDEGNT